MKNFKNSVPSVLQAKIAEVANLMFEDFDKIVASKRHGLIIEVVKDEIEGNHVSGWNPRQDGGFSLNAYFQNDIDSSYHFTEKQTEWTNGQIKNCFDSFLSDNGIDEAEFNVKYNLETGDEDFRQEFCEYESEWFADSALFQVQLFVEGYGTYDDGKNKVVTVRTSINYADEYGREKYAEDIKVIAYEIDEFMAIDAKTLIDEFTV